jgi:preprotein translocase subunit Sec63
MIKKTLLTLFIGSSAIYAQKKWWANDEGYLQVGINKSKCYAWLDDLSNKIGSRLSGSAERRKRLYTKAEMEKLGFDRVFLRSNGAKMGTWRKKLRISLIIKIKFRFLFVL